jgi:hypothetical protein
VSSLPPNIHGTPDGSTRGKGGGLDVLTQNAGEMTRRVHARDLAANLVTAIFRVVKLSTLHAIDNQAMVRQVEETVAIVSDYCQRTEHNVSILFAHGSVFVGGLLLRANRGVYEGALELGEILEKIGAAEIGIARDVRPADFYDLASALADSLRSAKSKRIERPSPRIRLRGFNAAALGREGAIEQRLAPAAQVASTYASAVVIMRRFFEDLRRGKYELPQRVKRVAQRLVDLSIGETPAFLGVTAARNANHDAAGRAVNTAILSLSMTRQITSDPVMLSRVAMAALLYDAARARIAGVVGQGAPAVMPQLSEQQESESPAGTAVVLTALGRINEPSVMRTVITYEAHWVKRRASLRPLYRGLRQPSMQARIIAVARAFNDLLTTAPGVAPPSADEVIACLEKEATEPADRTALRLLVGALGLFPTGTLVELSTGEVAVVVQTPSHPSLYSQPRVRVVLDVAGGALPRPIEIDLAQQRRRSGEQPRYIRRVVATSDDATAASLRALASGPVAASEASAKGVPGASGIRAQGGVVPKTVPPPSSVNSPRPAAPNSRIPTLASQFTRHDSASPPERSAEVEVQTDLGTRAVAWDEQATLLDSARSLDEAAEGSLNEPFSDDANHESAERPPVNAPTAEGTLVRTPFVHLLIYMLEQRLTGTTVFQSPSGVTHSIYFHDGAPSKVRTGTMVAPLDRVLVEQGLLDEATLRGTMLEISKLHVLHGRYLVMKGLTDRDTILATLRLQLLRKVTYLFELPAETRYAYYEGENLLASYGGPELTPCEPLAVIMAGIRLRASDPLVDATLLRISGRTLALHIDAELRRFHLQRDERSVVDLIRARRMTLDDVLNAGVAQERVVRLTIYALVLARHLDMGSGRTPIGIHRDWSAFNMVESAPVRESGAAGAPAPTAAAARQISTQPRVQSRPSPSREDPSPAQKAQPHSPNHRQTTRIPQPDRMMRPTTRIPRLADSADADGRPPSSGTPAPQVLRTPGWRSSTRTPPGRVLSGPDPATPPRPTTKLPRVVIPPEAYDTADDDASSSSRAPPSSGSALPAAAAAFERSSASAVTPPSPEANGPGPAAPINAPTQPRRPAMKSEPIGTNPSSPAAGKAATSPEHAARRAEIERRSQSIDSEDYFQMLGIGRDATPEQIRSAYFALARTWHPDRLPGELADMKAPLGRVFSRFNDAYQALSDAARRKEYLERLHQGGGTADDDAKLARVVDAALEFQKAEILLKKHDLDGAEALATRAAEADPEQPEYVTLLVWIQAQRRGDPPGMQEGATSSHFDDLIQTLSNVLAKEPRYERALYYRGVLQKRAGRIDKAIRDFKLVAEINPKNIDAVREVRLHEMRRRTSPTSPPTDGGGLFGKFFKR